MDHCKPELEPHLGSDLTNYDYLRRRQRYWSLVLLDSPMSDYLITIAAAAAKIRLLMKLSRLQLALSWLWILMLLYRIRCDEKYFHYQQLRRLVYSC